MICYQDWSVQYYLSNGVPGDKLILGLPTYGHSWMLTNPETDFGVGARTYRRGHEQYYTATRGFLALYEVKLHIESTSAELLILERDQ